MSAAPGRPKLARTAVQCTEVFLMSAAPGRPKLAHTAVQCTELA